MARAGLWADEMCKLQDHNTKGFSLLIQARVSTLHSRTETHHSKEEAASEKFYFDTNNMSYVHMNDF